APEFLKQVAADRQAPANEARAALIARVAEHYARGGPVDTAGSLMVELAKANRGVADSILFGLAKGWPKDRKARLDEQIETAMVELLSQVSPAAKGQLVNLASRWGSQRFEQYTAEITGAFLQTVQDEKQSDAA